MSLISLSSNSKDDLVQQPPFNFKNHFPQPLIIKPNSQVALINFYHYRDDGYYRINSHNDIIAFAIGDANIVGYHYAKVATGRYDDGNSLATAIEASLNSAVVQQNYSFTVAFTAGNPNANPVEFDQFAITYAHVASPNSKGGSWSKLAGEPNNGLQITNIDTDNNQSIVQAEAGQILEATAVMLRGELTHEGTYRAVGISKFGSLAGNPPNFAVNTLRGCIVGLVRKQFSQLNTGNNQADFNSNFADIKVQVKSDPNANLEHSITVSTLRQRQGTTSILAPNGKEQVVKRVLPDAFVDANFQAEDLMGFEFIVISTTRAVLVRLLKSTDGGTTYLPLADNAGGANADGARNVYSQTINGTAYTGLIYNSNGVNDGQGGGVVAGTRTTNLISPKYAPFIPFITMDDDGVIVNGIDLDNVNFTTNFADADNDFTMGFTNQDLGMLPAYDFSLDIVAVETATGTLGSAGMDGLAMFKDTTDARGLTFRVHQNKAVAPTVGNFVGTMVFSTTDGGTVGHVRFTGLAVDPLDCETDSLPAPATLAWKMYLSGVFNHTNNQVRFTGKGLEMNNKTDNHDETIHGDNLGAEGTQVGADLPASSTFLLNRLNQADLLAGRGNPARLTGDLVAGTLGATIGFRDNFITNNNATFTITSDAETTKISQDNNIHISIPELPNVKSFEGENNNTGKTIKVLPKNEFTSNDDTGSMTFTANYEDYIDINNADELRLNELTVQVRNPDGTMANSLQPTTRATIKIRENPSVQEDKRLETMARMLSQRQNTSKDLMVDNRVGS